MVDEKTKQEIIGLYSKGKGSIQDLARIYRLDVPIVLDIVGEQKLAEVHFAGDLIDQSEAGRGTELSTGITVDVPFSLN